MAEGEKPRSGGSRRKKGGHPAAHHGGTWKVAYGDMITSLMALFFLLWLVTSLDEKTKKVLSAWFQDPGIFKTPEGAWILEEYQREKRGKPKPQPEPEEFPPPTRGKEIEQSKTKLRALAEEIRRLFSTVPKFRDIKEQIEVDFVDDGMRIQILDQESRPLFDAARATLRPTAREILEELSQRLTQLPNTVDISGHTDSVTYGKNPRYGNWELSVDRANSVRRFLTRSGLPANRIGRISGHADTQPHNEKDLRDPRNRRISIVVKYLLGEAKRPKQKPPAAMPGERAPPR